jgi:hypothetical protein
MRDDETTEPTPDNEQEETLLGSMMTKAKKMLGLDEAKPDSPAGQMMAGAKKLQDVVQKSKGPAKDDDGLLVGDSREIIHENVRTLKAKGYSEDDAIKRAHAAASKKGK